MTMTTKKTWMRWLAVGTTIAAALVLSPVASSGTVAADGAVAVTGLAQGATGDGVRAVQQALVDRGFAVAGGVDGVFGAGTTDALKRFQTREGLNATGTVDAATSLALGLTSSPHLGLAEGATGEAVLDLQLRLIGAGLSLPGGADGVFGAGTTAALKQFQASKGYAKTGSVNAATAVAIGKVTPASAAPAAPAAIPSPATPTPATPAPAAAGSALSVGSRGDAVKSLQQQLIAAGFPGVGKVDGIFGALTANALRAFQRSAGLTADGIADEPTLAALAVATSGSNTAPSSAPLVGLAKGARGEAVKALQAALIKAGAAVKGGADGVFGAGTKAAVTQFQQALGLAATGAVDQATASALAAGTKLPQSAISLVGLKAGAVGDAVKALQSALIKVGVSINGGADGIFGPATGRALRAFQTSQGLAASGVVDDATVAALQNPKAPVGTGSGNGSGGGSGSDAGGFATFGEKGERVLALQAALVKAGISVRGGVDGDFGAGTSAAIMDFQRARGLTVTGKVDAATAAALGLSKLPTPAAPDPASVSISVFPVQGRCGFIDTFRQARGGGRDHLGVDIIAPEGKLVYAVADGKITKVYSDYPGSLSGNGVRLTTADGTYFFYAHLLSLAPGIELGVPVKAGQVLGYVGSTGNSGTNHLHFEIHPKGGSAVNPYPIVKAIDGCRVTEPRPPV